jgi:hypothetical protein
VERFGFVGLPNAGKSSLYNALAGGGALAAPYAFATVDPNVGVAKVPDDRLMLLAEMSQTKTIIPASVQFVDIAGLVEGAAQGEGLGNRFLAHIREVDAIVFVLRAFVDIDVPGSSDPVEQLSTLEVELVYSDLETLEKQSEKRRKAARVDKTLADEVAAMDAAIDALQAGVPIYRAHLDPEVREHLSSYFLLTDKPAMALVNLDEEQLEDPDRSWRRCVSSARRSDLVMACASSSRPRQPCSTRTPRRDARRLGLGGALQLPATVRMLGLRTFLTTGEKETRAWTFRAGSKAPQAAGVIHTDFERGFIRVETVQWDELLAAGSWAKARDAGILRVEGKDYEVADGDVMHFRFNV